MWLLTANDSYGSKGSEVLIADPQQILTFTQNTGKSYSIRWIPTYEPPKESAEPNVKIGKNYEPVPLSRAKETGE